jgi:hypothetical protein
MALKAGQRVRMGGCRACQRAGMTVNIAELLPKLWYHGVLYCQHNSSFVGCDERVFHFARFDRIEELVT